MRTTSTGSFLTIATTSDSFRPSPLAPAPAAESCAVGPHCGTISSARSPRSRSCIFGPSPGWPACGSIALHYHSVEDREAIEVMELDARGQVHRVTAHYGARPATTTITAPLTLLPPPVHTRTLAMLVASRSSNPSQRRSAMPLINVKLIEDVFTSEQKRQIVERLTDAMVSIEGENMRGVTLGRRRGGSQRRLGHRRPAAEHRRCQGARRRDARLTTIGKPKPAGARLRPVGRQRSTRSDRPVSDSTQ